MNQFELNLIRIVSCAIVFILGIALAAWLSEWAFAQSPQNAVRISYVQCPPDMKYDPKRHYHQFKHLFGTADNGVMCTEYVDRKPDGAQCQIAFTCEDAT
ncbi:MAG: hypothetical protein KJN72_10685 [Woeseia sp.]|nr:hypothetical protein [Woeseia sp.]